MLLFYLHDGSDLTLLGFLSLKIKQTRIQFNDAQEAKITVNSWFQIKPQYFKIWLTNAGNVILRSV